MRRLFLWPGPLALAAVVGWSAIARADTDSGGRGLPVPPESAGQDPAASAREVDKPAKSSFELGGQVFVRDTVSTFEVADERIWRSERSIERARLGLEYERKKRLLVSLEVDFADDDVELKDTFVRVTPGRSFRVQAGRFKRPMSIIGLESRWSLPSVERGLFGGLEVEGVGLPFDGGRGDGFLLRYRAPVETSPTLSVAMFQNSLGLGVGGLDASEDFTQDLFARFELEPVDDVTFAASGALIGHLRSVGDVDTYRHAPVASAEVGVEAGRVRLLAEGFVGKSMFPQVGTDARGAFWAARTLIGVPFEPSSSLRRVEPYLLASIFEPTTRTSEDRTGELAGGVNLSFSKYYRLQAEMAHRVAEGVNSPTVDGTVFRLQLGARFNRDWPGR